MPHIIISSDEETLPILSAAKLLAVTHNYFITVTKELANGAAIEITLAKNQSGIVSESWEFIKPISQRGIESHAPDDAISAERTPER